MEINIRNATLLELPSIANFAKTVERLISADEIRTWMQVDPEAMFVAETSPDGKFIGCCCGVRLTPELGFMGLYVVLEECRGKGVGMKLWKAAKEHIGERNVGVHAEPENFKKFVEKEGFCHVEDYVIVFYECFGNSVSKNRMSSSDVEIATYFEGNLIGCNNKLYKIASSTNECTIDKEFGKAESGLHTNCEEKKIMKNVKSHKKNSVAEKYYNSCKSGVEYADEYPACNTTKERTFTNLADDEIPNGENQIMSHAEMRKSLDGFHEISFNSMNQNAVKNSMAEEILSKVAAFDSSVHNRDRSFVVRQTFFWSSCLSKVALLEGKVVGYACLRRVLTDNWIISPFYADTEDIAEMLLFEFIQKFDFSRAPKGITLRFPDKNIACRRLAEKFGFREKTTRISTGFTKHCIKTDSSKIYSLHSIVFCNV